MVFKRTFSFLLVLLLLLLPNNTNCKGFSNNYKTVATIITISTFLVGAVSWKFIKHWYNMRKLHIKIDTLTKDVSVVKNGVENLDGGVKDLKTDVSVVKKSIETVESGVKEVNAGVGRVENSVEIVDNNVRELKADVSAVKNGIETVDNKIKDLKTDVGEVKNGVESLENGFKELDEKTKKNLAILLTEFEGSMKNMKKLSTRQEDLKNLVGAVDDNLSKTGDKITSDIEKLRCELKMFIGEKFDSEKSNNENSFSFFRQFVEQKFLGLDSRIQGICGEFGKITVIIESLRSIAFVAGKI